MTTLSGGDNIVQALEEIARRMGGGSVSVGFMDNATYPDGTPVAAVAFWNEFGHGGKFPAPPRPFFRNMIATESPTWPGKLAGALQATGNAVQALSIMGADIEGALKDSIRSMSAPALSKTTLMLRATFGNQPQAITLKDVLQAQRDVAANKPGASGTGAHPLVWTGHMLNSITYKVSP